jgi:hypothetical protein
MLYTHADAVSEEIYQQLSEHRRLTYGSFKSSSDDEMMAKKNAEMLKANKIQLLKDLRSNKKSLKSTFNFSILALTSAFF